MTKELVATKYVKRNGGIVLREALPLSDPEHWVQLWLKEFGDLYGFPWIETYGEWPPVHLLQREGIDPGLVYWDLAGLDN